MSLIDIAVAAAAKAREARPNEPTEAERIVALPTRPVPVSGSDEMEEIVERWVKHFGRPGQVRRRLNDKQALALQEAAEQSRRKGSYGVIASLGVGVGKTLLAQLLPGAIGAQRTLILGPAPTLPQYAESRVDFGREYRLPHSQVVSYSQLSSKSGKNLFKLLRPDCIICDEAHKLKDLGSARTRRFVRYLNENPDTRLICMTGTLITSSLLDLLHLMFLSLRDGSPVPRPDHEDAKLWASVVDADKVPSNNDYAEVAPIVTWAGRTMQGAQDDKTMKSVCRKAIFDRMAATPGFIFTTSASCSAELRIHAERGPGELPVIKQALDQLEDDWILPNGEPVVDALGMHRAAHQLSMGFYMRWAWEESDVGEKDAEWLEARAFWHSTCRQWLKAGGKAGMDTIGLLQDAVLEGRPVHPEIAHAWRGWDAQRHKPPPPTEVVWLDPTPTIHAINWLKDKQEQGERALLWWQSTEALIPFFEQAGIKVYGSGGDPLRLRREQVAAPSYRVFGTGANLQPFTHHLVLEPPSSSAMMEQLLGRSHRQGREAPVDVHIAQWTWVQQQALARAMRRARAAEDLLHQHQRLLHASLHGFSKQFLRSAQIADTDGLQEEMIGKPLHLVF